MADHPQKKAITTIGSVVIFGLVLLAMRFGMDEWKSTPSAIADAPVPAPVITR